MPLEHCKHCGREYERSQGKKLYCGPECTFRGKLVVKGPDECWPWTASPSLKTYGKVWLGDKHERTHRYAYILHHGSIPEGMCVLHRCDNPLCCNPAHLFIGSDADNAADMVKKGRHVGAKKGSLHPHAILNEEKVLDIKKRLAEGQRNIDIGKVYGVAPQLICSIKKGRRWKHVHLNPVKPDPEHPCSIGPFQWEEEKFPLL